MNISGFNVSALMTIFYSFYVQSTCSFSGSHHLGHVTKKTQKNFENDETLFKS